MTNWEVIYQAHPLAVIKLSHFVRIQTRLTKLKEVSMLWTT
jgi:hypothetical protein